MAFYQDISLFSNLKGRGDLSDEEGVQTLVTTKALIRCPICQGQSVRSPLGVQGTMVGKASIQEFHQFRSLHVQEPWAEESALQAGPLAKGEWLEEQNTPPLDNGPNLPAKSLFPIKELVTAVPVQPAEFTESEWGMISQMGDKVIASVGGLGDSAYSYISEWRNKRKPTTATAEGTETFQNFADPDLYEEGLQMATYGSDTRAHFPPIGSP